jgi:hypothetical protein
MSILTTLRERFSTREEESSAVQPDAERRPATETQLPFAGYDRLDDREVIEGLSDHSQIELEAVESFERSHQERASVLDKLRWMRGSEPLPGYDALSLEEVATALKEADLTTVKKVRAYERKFANRRDVLEEVVRAHHRLLESEPASAAPVDQPTSYEPNSAGSVASPDTDRTQNSSRP